MATKRDKLLPRARRLFIEAFDVGQITELLGISEATFRRWRKYDEGRGADWEALRDGRRRTDPREIIVLLDEQLAGLARDTTIPLAVKADALGKLDKVITSLRDRHDDLDGLLDATEKLVDWGLKNLDRKDYATLGRFVNAFLDDVEIKYGG